MWPSLLDCSKALGLNGIATYVFWNFHEPERDVYDFSGDRDLGRFLELCKEARFTSSFAADLLLRRMEFWRISALPAG